jgi:hypothetical protein
MTHVTIHSNSLALYEYVAPHITAVDLLKPIDMYQQVKVFINGSWIGIANDPIHFKTIASPVSIGDYSDVGLRYALPGSLIKFIPTSGKYFDQNNNLISIPVSGIVPNGGKDYVWTSVYQVIGDGSNNGAGKLDNGTGPVILSSRIPSGAIPVEVIPKFVQILNNSIETEIVNLCMGQRNFGLTINVSSRQWEIILNSNLNLINDFNLSVQGNVDDLGLDSSWIIAFVWTGKNYKVRYRNLDFIFESSSDTSFYIDTSSINYDFSTNSIIKDKIVVLETNPQPQSNRAWLSGSGAPTATTIANNGDYYINVNATINNVYRNISGIWLQGNSFSSNIGLNYEWQIDSPIIELDGYVEPNKVKVSFYNYNNTGQIEDPDSFTSIVNPEYVDLVSNVKTNFVYFKKTTNGLRYTLVDGILPFDIESDFFTYKITVMNSSNAVADGDLFYFYNPTLNVIKYWSTTLQQLVYTNQYFARVGRSGLSFQYVHNSSSTRRVDPSKSNIIDIYVLTTGYDNAIRSWLLGNIPTEPLTPTSSELEQNYLEYLEPIKSISDEIIFHSVKYKILFGSNASNSLQAKFKAVRNSQKPTTDNDLKTRILTAINEFFVLENWEFGQSFYFSELSTYVMNSLSPDITNFIITPKNIGSFGSLYEITCLSNEIFISSATVSDIEIIDAITASQLNSQSLIVTSSGT